MAGNRHRGWVSAILGASLLMVGCGDVAVDEPEGLPPLPASSPAFDDSADCGSVEHYHRHQSIELKQRRPRAEFRDLFEQRIALLETVAATSLGAEVGGLATSIAIEEEFLRRVLAEWGTDGSDLIDELDRTSQSLYRRMLVEPVVEDGRTLSAGLDDALGHLDSVDDRLLLACTSPPEGWSRPSDDRSLELPDLPFLARSDGGGWASHVLSGAGTSAQAPVVLEEVGGLAPLPDSSSLLGLFWSDWSLHLIEPSTWSATPIEGAGGDWSCPSLSVDGSSVLGDLVDQESGERTPVIFPLDADEAGADGPRPLPDNVASCPVSVGGDEVTFADWDSLVAVSPDGAARDLLTLDGCLLVPYGPAIDGVLDVYANCANPYHDGLHLLDVRSGEVTHAITGLVGFGDVSEDGRWRLFAHVTVEGSVSDTTLWVMDQETGRTRSLGLAQFFPVFVPAASPGR